MNHTYFIASKIRSGVIGICPVALKMTMPTTRTVDNFIFNLRKKLKENASKPKHIISVRGIGYRFVSGN